MSVESPMQRSKNDISPNSYSSLLEAGQLLTTENSLRNIGSIAQAIIYQNMGREDLVEQMNTEKSPEYLYVQSFNQKEKDRKRNDELARQVHVEYLERQYALGSGEAYIQREENIRVQNLFLEHQQLPKESRLIIPDSELDNQDKEIVGGKSASLGEMVKLSQYNINVPRSFSTTSEMYHQLLNITGINAKIEQIFQRYNNPQTNTISLDLAKINQIHQEVTALITNIKVPESIINLFKGAYSQLCEQSGQEDQEVAVRSSATTEDLEGTSSAGQQETFLNVRGIKDLINCSLLCMASLYTVRAITYRAENNQPQFGPQIALCIAVQKMARGDLGVAGVCFSSDVRNRNPEKVIINASYGLGEKVVQDEVNPDQYIVNAKNSEEDYDFNIERSVVGEKEEMLVFNVHPKDIVDQRPLWKRLVSLRREKPGSSFVQTLETSTDMKEELALEPEVVLELSRIAKVLENHYSEIEDKFTPMDAEFVVTEITKENDPRHLVHSANGKKYLVELLQARPITTGLEQYNLRQQNKIAVVDYKMLSTPNTVPYKGVVAQPGVVVGAPVDLTKKPKITIEDLETIKTAAAKADNKVVLFVKKTDPDAVSLFKALNDLGIKFALTSDTGGKTSHIAIVAREMGIPLVVNCKSKVKELCKSPIVTFFFTESDKDGIYPEKIEYSTENVILDIPTEKTRTQIKFIAGNSDLIADKLYDMPMVEGIGLVRWEIEAANIGIHPNALANFDKLDDYTKALILEKIPVKDRGDLLAWERRQYINSIRTACLASAPHNVIIRNPDFKSNEYLELIGGHLYEPHEENPMLGMRGGLRYLENPKWFKEQVCQVYIDLYNEGITNFDIMLPFVHTAFEAQKLLELMAESGLKRHMYGKVLLMCELPSNVIEIEEFMNAKSTPIVKDGISEEPLTFDGISIGTNDLTQLTLGIDRDAESESLLNTGNASDPAVMKQVVKVSRIVKSMGKYVGVCGNLPFDYPEVIPVLVNEAKVDSLSFSPDITKVYKAHERILQAEREMSAAA